MNPSYKKEKDNDYLILEAPGRPDGSEYQIRMLLLNQMEKILPCKMRKMDGIPEFFYDITCRQPMTRAFERRQMKKEDIEALLNSLEKALDEAGRYLLDMRQFVLKPDYIFRDVENGGFSFCYLPFYNGNLEEDFRELAEYILKRLDHNQEEAVLWGYDIYSRSMEENFSIGKILESARERTGRENARLAAENPVETEAELLEVDEDILRWSYTAISSLYLYGIYKGAEYGTGRWHFHTGNRSPGLFFIYLSTKSSLSGTISGGIDRRMGYGGRRTYRVFA